MRAQLIRQWRRHPWLLLAVSLYLMLSAVEVARRLAFERPASYAVGFYDWERAPAPDTPVPDSPAPDTPAPDTPAPGPQAPEPPASVSFRWSGAEASLSEPPAGTVVKVPLYLARPDISSSPVEVTISVAGVPMDRVLLDRNGWFEIGYYLPPILGREAWSEIEKTWTALPAAGAPGPLPRTGEVAPPAGPPTWDADGAAMAAANGGPAREKEPEGWLSRWFAEWKELRNWSRRPRPPSVALRFAVDSTFVPARVGDSLDWRRLGVGIGELGWADELPAGGLGFHGPEIDGTGRTFRWTRRLASLPLVVHGREMLFEMRALHPDVTTREVIVDVYWQATKLLEVRLDGTDWRAVRTPVGAPRGSPGVLSFRVDRTWNPAEMGASDDGRDLGVSVTEVKWR